MKKSDFIFILVLCIMFLPFVFSKDAYNFYMHMSGNHAMIMGFIQYALLATIGEMLGLRLQTGVYVNKELGVFPRALVWGTLGLTIVAAIRIFGVGTPVFLDYVFGLDAGTFNGAIFAPEFSGLKLLGAFFMAFFMDVFFSPLFMIVFTIYDMHIKQTGGTLSGFFTNKVQYSNNLQSFNWKVQWQFVFMKTIPFFWIPAHTIMYLIPTEFQVLMSSMLGIVLGVILFIANRK
ncbi:hypothetical protein D0T50_07960 [Bacteroides sp. 214]|uniref:hypothetical protein n=1 Tax=Bacteroides sp. 214 TaxID=2302935 RepID=UPI0013D0520A|nr:hypothetical protein [Bacteroides sp. 214]NDW12824.1 hypothetical protein [Bacteroides sp. 214]